MAQGRSRLRISGDFVAKLIHEVKELWESVCSEVGKGDATRTGFRFGKILVVEERNEVSALLNPGSHHILMHVIYVATSHPFPLFVTIDHCFG